MAIASTDFAVFSTRSARAGSFDYERGPMPGETFVQEDQTRIYYKIPRGMRRGFRQWYATVGDADRVVRGTYRNGYYATTADAGE